MNLFQYITLPMTITLLAWSFIQFVSRKQSRLVALVWTIIWLAASVAILNPGLTIKVAGILGIGRGADLVLYMLTISFLIFMIYSYQRFQRLESSITEIVRQIALQSAAKTEETDGDTTQNNAENPH